MVKNKSVKYALYVNKDLKVEAGKGFSVVAEELYASSENVCDFVQKLNEVVEQLDESVSKFKL